jgi:hypothetical protein
MSLYLHRAGLMTFKAGTVAFPTIRSTLDHNPGTFSQSHTVNLPSGVQTGDLLVMFLVARATVAGLTDVTVSGWTRLDTSPLLSAQAFYIIAPSAITTASISTPSINTSITTNSYCFSAYSLIPTWIWTNGTGAAPEPTGLTVPSNWRSNPHVTYISSLHLFGDVTANGSPGSYGNQISSTSSNNNRTYSVRRNLQAASDDPSAWSITGTNPSLQSWACATVGIRGPE